MKTISSSISTGKKGGGITLRNSLRISAVDHQHDPILSSYCVYVQYMYITPHTLCRFTVILYHSAACIPLYDTCVHVCPCRPSLCEGYHCKWSSCITAVKITMATAAFAGNEIMSSLFWGTSYTPPFIKI